MTVKERILAIRVITKVKRNPRYAARIGINAELRKQKCDSGDGSAVTVPTVTSRV